MAGGNHIKNSSSKPSSSSSSHRKSRWESGNTHHHPPSDKKPSSSAAVAGGNDPKSPSVPPLKSKPPSRSNPTPSPGHPKPPSDRALQPGSGPSPSGAPFHYPDPLGPPPPQIPAYDFHMLERRTIALADGSVRSYFALPPDYDDFAPPLRPMDPTGRFHPEMPRPGFGFDRHFGPMGPEFLDRDRDDIFNRNPDNTLKRKYGDEGIEGNDDFARQRRQLLQYGNAGSNSHGYSLGLGGRGEFVVGTSSPMVRGGEMRAAKNMRLDGGYEGGRGNVGPLRHNEVDQEALKKAFLYFAKLVNENPAQRNNYLADGKQGPVQCVACGRSSQAFPDTHGLVMHAYNSDSADLRVDHLGLHKALCILMRWNYLMPPDNSKAYQILSADEAAANQDDLIMWPPMVIIHNTVTGKGRDARIEGLGNKAMDNKLRDLGFGGGKAKSLYGREGHLGITLVKFAGDQSGLKEALRLAEFFEKENRGRSRWAAVQSLTSGKDEENNPNLVKVDKKTGERERIFYGYLGTVLDLEKVDFESRKKLVIESARDYRPSK